MANNIGIERHQQERDQLLSYIGGLFPRSAIIGATTRQSVGDNNRDIRPNQDFVVLFYY